MPKQLTIPEQELWDPKLKEFFYIKEQTIVIEHSLVSLSKWEQKWHVPFLSTKDKTREQTIDYIRMMTITQHVDPMAYYALTNDHFKDISEYINDPMTATTFRKSDKAPSREIVTSELIYYWMIEFGIPVEFQKWHLNRLMTLIRVCSIKQTPAKKMGKKDIYSQNAELNAARRKARHSKG